MFKYKASRMKVKSRRVWVWVWVWGVWAWASNTGTSSLSWRSPSLILSYPISSLPHLSWSNEAWYSLLIGPDYSFTITQLQLPPLSIFPYDKLHSSQWTWSWLFESYVLSCLVLPYLALAYPASRSNPIVYHVLVFMAMVLHCTALHCTLLHHGPQSRPYYHTTLDSTLLVDHAILILILTHTHTQKPCPPPLPIPAHLNWTLHYPLYPIRGHVMALSISTRPHRNHTHSHGHDQGQDQAGSGQIKRVLYSLSSLLANQCSTISCHAMLCYANIIVIAKCNVFHCIALHCTLPCRIMDAYTRSTRSGPDLLHLMTLLSLSLSFL